MNDIIWTTTTLNVEDIKAMSEEEFSDFIDRTSEGTEVFLLHEAGQQTGAVLVPHHLYEKMTGAR
jgi:hypothetical protein